MELFLLTHLPAWALALMFSLGAAALGVGGLVLFRRRFPPDRLQDRNEIAGVLISIVGGLYGVLLAFIVAIAWEQFGDAEAVADREAVLTVSLYRDADRFPAHSAELRADIARYARAVIDPEWTIMAEQRGDSRAVDDALRSLGRSLIQLEPRTPQQTALYPEFVSRVTDLEQVRQNRISAASTKLPRPMWWVLVVGGMINVAFTYFFGLASRRAHVVMVAAVGATIGLTLFLIASLDLPFTGSLAVEPDAMRDALAEFAHIPP